MHTRLYRWQTISVLLPLDWYPRPIRFRTGQLRSQFFPLLPIRTSNRPTIRTAHLQTNDYKRLRYVHSYLYKETHAFVFVYYMWMWANSINTYIQIVYILNIVQYALRLVFHSSSIYTHIYILLSIYVCIETRRWSLNSRSQQPSIRTHRISKHRVECRVQMIRPPISFGFSCQCCVVRVARRLRRMSLCRRVLACNQKHPRDSREWARVRRYHIYRRLWLL